MSWTVPDKGEGASDVQSILFQEDIEAAIVDPWAGTFVQSGCAVTPQGSPDMTVAVASGVVYSAGARLAVTGANATIGTADGSNPRIDLVVINAAGAIAVRAGTAAAAPKPPARTAGDVVLAAVFVPASDTAISAAQIIDKRIIAVRAMPDHIALPDIATPSVPSSGVLLWGKNRAGRSMPNFMGPSGIDVGIQPALFANNFVLWLPGTGTTVAINFGTSFTARNSGTSAAQAHPARASTNALTQMARATFGTGTTATGASGIQSSATVAWRGNAAGLGGFFFHARFGIETLASDIRAFVGLSANNAAIAADPSSWNNTIGICKDTADSTWQVLQRNGTTATKSNTGCTVTAGQVLDLYMFAAPNGSTVTVRLVDAFTGTVYIDNVAYNTTLPVNTTFLYMQAHIQSVTGTTAKLLALNKMYLESDS